MFNRKSINIIISKRKHDHSEQQYSKESIEISNSVIPRWRNRKVDNSIFYHCIHQSLMYKDHLFNINPQSFNLDFLNNKKIENVIICKHGLSKHVRLRKYEYNKYKIPSNAIKISWPSLPDTTFYVFHVSQNMHYNQYLLQNIRHDIDLKILQNVLKLSLFYQNLSNAKIATIIRYYLLFEYYLSKRNNLTNYKLIDDIINCKDKDIIYLINKCKKKISMIIGGTTGLIQPKNGFEWIAIAMNKNKWIKITMTIYPDRRYIDNDNNNNKYQFHMFITRNFQYNLHQWLNKQSTTPKLSLYLHITAKIALNAKHVISRPIATMKKIMENNGFHKIRQNETNKIIKQIGLENYEYFNGIQGSNDWLISPQRLNFFTLKSISLHSHFQSLSNTNKKK